MARKNLLLTLSLLVMVAALIAGILYSDPGRSTEPETGEGPPLAVGAEDTVPEPVTAPMTTPVTVPIAEPGEDLAAAPARTDVTPGATPVAAGVFRLSGRLIEADESPAVGVPVSYRSLPNTARLVPGESMTLGAADETDAEGRFEIVIEGGGAIRNGRLSLGDEAGRLFEMTSSPSITVAGGQRPIDLGTMRLIAASTVAGRVIDESGAGIGGLEIAISRTAALMGRSARIVPVEADGSFEVALAPGAWILETRSPKYLPGRSEVEVVFGENLDDIVLRVRAGSSVHGVVLDDLGRPVEGARVGAFKERKVGTTMTVDSLSMDDAVETDAAGRFTLGGVENGETVRLRAWGSGHVAASASGVAGATEPVTITVERHGIVAGVVVDAGGKPVAGSRVEVVTEGELGLEVFGEADDGVTTGADGAFRLENVAPGTVAVRASGAGHRAVTQTGVLVRPGEESAPVRLVAEVGASIAVQVLDADSRPVAHAVVTVRERREGMTLPGGMRMERREIREEVRREGPNGRDVARILGGPETLASASTDAEGRVVLSGLAAGPVTVEAQHTQHAAGRPVNVVLPRTGQVEAQVTMLPAGFVDITVLDPDGTTRAGVSCMVEGPMQAGESTRRQSNESDQDGKLRFGPLAPGRYRAALTKSPAPVRFGGGEAFVSFGAEQDEIAETTFEVAADQTVDIRLIHPVLTTLSGVVRNLGGPVGGVEVRVAKDGTLQLPFSGGPSARTADDGTFSIEGLSAGDYTLSWGRTNAVVRHEQPLILASGEREVSRVLILGGGTLRVQVFDEVSGEPIEGATVRVERIVDELAAEAAGTPARQPRMVAITMDVQGGPGGPGGGAMSITSGGPPAVETDVEGVAVIEEVPSGEYRVSVSHRQHVSDQIDRVVVTEGGEVAVPVLRLASAGTLIGSITGFPDDLEGPRLANVTVREKGGEGESRTEFAMNGSARITGLAPGTYEASAAQVPNGAPGPWVEFEIRAGERTRAQIPLK